VVIEVGYVSRYAKSMKTIQAKKWRLQPASAINV
jgi:hypothetical protein